MIEPGIYRDTPYHVYASWNAVRASTLNACSKSLAHGREAETNPKNGTAALEFGTAFHTALLEPERFQRDYVVAPKFDKRNPAEKKAWQEFNASLGDRTAITEDDNGIAAAMYRAVYDHRVAGELLSGASMKEVSFVWRDEATGQLCKGRIDALTTYKGWTYVLDLKSTRDASRIAFQRQMTNFGYYRSQAWYRHGLNVLAPHPRKCVLLAVEKTAPYCVAPYELDEGALVRGMEEMQVLLGRYAEAKASGIWPGYTDDVVSMELPRWKNEQSTGDAA